MRRTFVVLAVLGFAGLALVDLVKGNRQVGIASLCLAIANGLLLSQ